MSLKLFFSLKLTNVQRVPLNFFRNLLRQNVFQFRMLRLCLCTYSLHYYCTGHTVFLKLFLNTKFSLVFKKQYYSNITCGFSIFILSGICRPKKWTTKSFPGDDQVETILIWVCR